VSAGTTRRRTAQLAPWLATGLAAVIVASCLALTAWTWMQEDEMKDLRASVEAERQARATAEAQIIALESAATALESRLAVLEAGGQPGEPVAIDLPAGSSDPSQEIADLEAALGRTKLEVQGIRSVLNEVLERMDNPASPSVEPDQGALPETRLTVARQQQAHNLSCESSAASMVAQYYGVPLSEGEVLASLPLDPNPYLGFRGNVDGPTGGIVDYGVYAGPVADVLNANGLQAQMITGGIEGIKSAIERGNPVIAWVTYNCEPSTPTTQLVGGQEVVLVPNQHVVVVTGYDADGVWANDPWDGREDFYATSDFVRAMSYFGDMAIEVAKP
jgi:uncharacterized protein YvpB